jgi:hypothetical protein
MQTARTRALWLRGKRSFVVLAVALAIAAAIQLAHGVWGRELFEAMARQESVGFLNRFVPVDRTQPTEHYLAIADRCVDTLVGALVILGILLAAAMLPVGRPGPPRGPQDQEMANAAAHVPPRGTQGEELPDKRLTRRSLAALGAGLILWRVFLVAAVGIRPFYSTFWQIIDLDILRANPLGTLWDLHMQPPLFNGLVYLASLAHGSGPAWPMMIFNMALGCGAALAVSQITFEVSRCRALSLVVGALVGLHPGLIFLETLTFYSAVTCYVLVFAVWALVKYLFHHRARDLVIAGCFTGAGALLQGLFAPVVVVFGLVVLLASQHKGARGFIRPLALLYIVPAILLVPLHVKNLHRFGFFGTSSWLGMNLADAVYFTPEYTKYVSELAAKASSPREVRDAAAARLMPFSRMGSYEPLGYTKKGGSPALDYFFNNVNYVDISASYRRVTGGFIRRYPAVYLERVTANFIRSWQPPIFIFEARSTRVNRESRLRMYDSANPLLRGAARTFCSLSLASYILLFAGLVCVLLFPGVRRAWLPRAADRLAYLLLVGLNLSIVLAGACFESGENDRFKSLAEPLIFVTAFWFLAGVRRAWGPPSEKPIQG